ncbi:hypothetical [Yersinia pestis KIM10+]|uniref:Uncharacterized protein n=1 Tax=Yersinia pestis TaxID=632 RepID=Q8CKC3_YERPE|nr:hypothetical [Yersinia pestis KIM10+]
MFEQQTAITLALILWIDGDIEQCGFIQHYLGNSETRHFLADAQLKIEVPVALITGERFFRPWERMAGLFNLVCCGQIGWRQDRNLLHNDKSAAKVRA